MADQTVSIVIRARDMASRVISGTNRTLKQLGISARGLGLAFGAVAATATGLGVVGAKLFDIGSSALETRSKFDTVFGAATDRVRAFGDEFSVQAGLVRRAGEDILATTGSIVQGMDFTEQAAADTAISVVKLAGDIGSFNNRETADVAHAIQSAITGEREQLKSLGIVIQEADVQQRALALSGKSAASSLTQQERATATLQLITERAGRAIGDLDRTSDSAANTARRVRAQFGNIVEDFSIKMIPVFASLLPLLEELAGKVAKLTIPLVDLLKRGADMLGLYSLTAEGTAASMAAVEHNTGLVIRRERELAAQVEQVSVAFVEAEHALDRMKRTGSPGEIVEATARYRELGDALRELQGEYDAVADAAKRAQEAQDAAVEAGILSLLGLSDSPTGAPGTSTKPKTAAEKAAEAARLGQFNTQASQAAQSKRASEKSELAEQNATMQFKLATAKRIAAEQEAAEQLKIAASKRAQADELAAAAARKAAFSSEDFAVSLLNSGAQIVNILRGETGGGFLGGLGALAGLAGGIVSGINPLVGAGLGLAGSLIGAAAGGGGSEIPVRVERYGESALSSLRDIQTKDITFTAIIRQDGAEVWRMNQALLELTRQDGTFRILPVGGGRG